MNAKNFFTNFKSFSKIEFSQNSKAVCQTVKQAFFMPKKLVNPPFIQQDKTAISYNGWLILQNKALSQICGAVAFETESETNHPNLGYFLKTSKGAFIMLKSYLSFYVSLIATVLVVIVILGA